MSCVCDTRSNYRSMAPQGFSAKRLAVPFAKRMKELNVHEIFLLVEVTRIEEFEFIHLYLRNVPKYCHFANRAEKHFQSAFCSPSPKRPIMSPPNGTMLRVLCI